MQALFIFIESATTEVWAWSRPWSLEKAGTHACLQTYDDDDDGGGGDDDDGDGDGDDDDDDDLKW